ncbi:hypothetical protein SSS_00339 [Sarcoptes scabiei]|uniref:Uncharacterized protein n=1 Tax=Sarcoptes scabiei TaxID=52283 RepID=A0A834REJ7_SARSC|nr:hypothetical protein SSS_00339 [Sarcoptes scabiei]
MSRRELQQLIKYNSPNFSKSPSHIHHEYSFNYELRSSSRTLRSRSVGTCFTPEISSKSKNGSNNCSLQTKSVKIVRKRLYSKTKCLESESITESKNCQDVAVFSTNNSTKVCKKKNFDTKDNNWESLLNNHVNQIDLKDLEFQHKCLKNLMELITNELWIITKVFRKSLSNLSIQFNSRAIDGIFLSRSKLSIEHNRSVTECRF